MGRDCGMQEEKVMTIFEKEGRLLCPIKLIDSGLRDLHSD